MFSVLIVCTAFITIATFLPYWRHPHWLIRGLDYPRLQIACLAMGLLLTQLLFERSADRLSLGAYRADQFLHSLAVVVGIALHPAMAQRNNKHQTSCARAANQHPDCQRADTKPAGRKIARLWLK